MLPKFEGKYGMHLRSVDWDSVERQFMVVFNVGGPPGNVEVRLWRPLPRRPDQYWSYEIRGKTLDTRMFEHGRAMLDFFLEILIDLTPACYMDAGLLQVWWAWDPLVHIYQHVDTRALVRRLEAMQEFMEAVSDWPPTTDEFLEAAFASVPESVQRDQFGHIHADVDHSEHRDHNRPRARCECEYCELRAKIIRYRRV